MVELPDVTFIFTVGGDDSHYQNLERCIRSIKKFYSGCRFLILEFGNRLSSSEETTVVDVSDRVDFSSGKKVGYIIWKHKYVGALMVETKFGVYVDTDTVIANPTLHEIIPTLNGGIGAALHFWVPTILDYQAKACAGDSLVEFQKFRQRFGLEDSSLFFAGGVFMFENNQDTKRIFELVLEMYEDYYSGKDYVRSITDELFLAAALHKNPGFVRRYGGALNHCSMQDDDMPLVAKDGTLFGRNLFEDYFQPVTFLHCDTSRRDPSKHYNGEERKLIRQAFELGESSL
jgi:hypothetical protein